MFVLFYVIHLTVANYTREFCFLPLSMIHTYLFVWDSFIEYLFHFTVSLWRYFEMNYDVVENE
jgi:hypothetical protein